jgi:hypothetical protein
MNADALRTLHKAAAGYFLHFIRFLNDTFTVLKNSRFCRVLRGQINCAAIVAP